MRCAAALLVLVCSLTGFGQTWQDVDDSDGRPNVRPPLPRHATEAERRLPSLPLERDAKAPPTGVVYCPAEYEACAGLFIAWEGFESILSEMAYLATVNDPNATVWVVVDSTSEQSSAYNYLNSAGCDMSQIEFVVRTTDSVWIRDYGPRFIYEDAQRAIVDHTYNRNRPNDNLLNDHITSLWGISQYQIPLVHGGGNFHLFANGDAFMSDLILSENTGLTEQDVKDLYLDYQNLDLTIYPGFPTSYDSTQHIDMWMMPVGDNKVIIGDYSIDHAGQAVDTITNNAAADMAARGYTVYRVRNWNSQPYGGGTHYTYTNSVILNDQVFMPKFGGSYASRDADALAVFQQAMPNHTIHQINCSGIISYAGALHCIVMHVPPTAPGPDPVVSVQQPNGGELWVIGQTYDIQWTASDDVGVTSVDILLSTDGGASYTHTIATGEANDGVFAWTVPSLASDMCRIKVIAYDADTNTGEDDSDADFQISHFGPQVVHDFPLDTDPGWTCTGLWEFGTPTGGGGLHGHPDPTAGYTGPYVYGYNLEGDYENALPERYLTSPALDLTGITSVQLAFWRWLGVESSTYDHAALRISTDGTSWSTIWQNTTEVTDSSWVYQEFDLSAWADDQPTVYLRWTMGPTDGSWPFCGWNIDDIQLIGVPSAPPTCLGDANCDGQIAFDDINPFVDAMINGVYCDGTGENVDMSDDDPVSVGFEDINPFVELLTTNPLPIDCP